MQSTKLLQSPLSELSEEEKGIAYNLLNRLVDGAVDENYTMLDYMQMARLYYRDCREMSKKFSTFLTS